MDKPISECGPASLADAAELQRLLHELNPEQDRDYVVRSVIEGERVGDTVEVSFNVRVRTRAAP